jgi:hypothetical protein
VISWPFVESVQHPMKHRKSPDDFTFHKTMA